MRNGPGCEGGNEEGCGSVEFKYTGAGPYTLLRIPASLVGLVCVKRREGAWTDRADASWFVCVCGPPMLPFARSPAAAIDGCPDRVDCTVCGRCTWPAEAPTADEPLATKGKRSTGSGDGPAPILLLLRVGGSGGGELRLPRICSAFAMAAALCICAELAVAETGGAAATPACCCCKAFCCAIRAKLKGKEAGTVARFSLAAEAEAEAEEGAAEERRACRSGDSCEEDAGAAAWFAGACEAAATAEPLATAPVGLPFVPLRLDAGRNGAADDEGRCGFGGVETTAVRAAAAAGALEGEATCCSSGGVMLRPPVVGEPVVAAAVVVVARDRMRRGGDNGEDRVAVAGGG